ncbi:MAG TPA: GDSL-type esterase/lipase family protein, partial [Salinimicrobium sp.]|nr:GDSL-type esterase/lipase family protein [Salinimicrobium sp.]
MKFNLAFLILSVSIFCISPKTQAQDPAKWENEIQKFKAQDKIDPPEKDALLFVGSSSIRMWEDVADYFPEHEIINRGFGGSQFSDLIYYADEIIYPYKPSKIFIYEGDNDLFAGEAIDSIMQEAKELRLEIREQLPHTEVIFIAAKPSMSRWEMHEKYEKFNHRLQEYAKETERTEFAEVWTAMLNENGRVRQDIFLKDG